ncbi:MAG: hypothetical protein K1X70_09490 [Leptospirales bacterium]|nr:hypothetical protein [Leptospirales bacterium]
MDQLTCVIPGRSSAAVRYHPWTPGGSLGTGDFVRAGQPIAQMDNEFSKQQLEM